MRLATWSVELIIFERVRIAIKVTLISCAPAALVLSSCVFNQAARSEPRLVTSGEQSIHVQLIDGKNGKPTTNVWVSLRGLGENNKTTQAQSAQTDSYGIAELHLRDPIPERLSLGFGPYDFASCSNVEFRSDEILHVGVVAKNTCAAPFVSSCFSPTARAARCVRAKDYVVGKNPPGASVTSY
jgi:5-hydroxyisourate hydrolase-like protein (transthyretin family)